MKVQSTIQKWGNSLALRLTGPVKAIPHFEENMLVDIEITEKSIKIYPAKTKSKKLRFTEKELLNNLNEETIQKDLLHDVSQKEMGENSA